MAELLDRARQLPAAGPYSIRAAETAAVHAAIYPSRDAVCETCPAELGKAYYAIKRWLDQQDSSSTSTTLTVNKNTSIARFLSESIILTPHGLGIAYSNDNLTDKAARYILKNDPDAAQFFKVLPPDAEEGEDETPAAGEATTQAAAPAASAMLSAVVPAGFDYNALASAMVDELERRAEERNTKFEQDMDDATAEQPALTASAGGAADGSDATDSTDTSDSTDNNAGTDVDGEDRPVRLSRMNKEQLVAAYTAELGEAPAEGLTNDELREAIAAKRSSLPSAE
jgi:hypothetical protein